MPDYNIDDTFNPSSPFFNGVPKLPVPPGGANAFLDAANPAILSAGEIQGNLDLRSTGFLRGGQTAFKTGDGVFMGYDTTSEIDANYTATDNIADYTFAEGTITAMNVKFTVTNGITNIHKIKVNLKKVSSNTGAIYCDLYLVNSTYQPTGDSLGQTSIAGITNDTYFMHEFVFDPVITVSSTSHYCFILTSPDTTTGIKVEYASPYSLPSGQVGLYISPTWYDYPSSIATYATYSKNIGYKFSTGNDTCQLSYNTNNTILSSSLIIKDPARSYSYSDYHSNGFSYVQGGIAVGRFDQNNGLQMRYSKQLTYGSVNYFQMTPYSTGSNDSFTYIGLDMALGSHSDQHIYFYGKQSGPTYINAKGGLVIGNGDNGTSFLEIGSTDHKATVYAYALSSCPLPTVDSALSMLNVIPEPKTKDKLKDSSKAHFENSDITKKRKYFDIDDMPDDLLFINNKNEKDIELTRVIGFLFKAVKELNEEIKTLKK